MEEVLEKQQQTRHLIEAFENKTLGFDVIDMTIKCNNKQIHLLGGGVAKETILTLPTPPCYSSHAVVDRLTIVGFYNIEVFSSPAS